MKLNNELNNPILDILLMDRKVAGEEVPLFIKAKDFHLYKGAKLIDVRSPDEYAEGHLRNAINAYDFFTYLLQTSRKDDIDQMKKYFRERFGQLGINGKEHVIVYEQSMSNQYGASRRAFFIFKYLNHRYVSILEDGLDALIRLEDGAEVISKEVPEITSCQYCEEQVNGNIYQMADRDEVLEIVKNKKAGIHLLDVRDAVEWNGLSSSPYGVDFTPRKGRIPDSIWIEWYLFHQMDNEKNVIQRKSNEEIQSLMKSKGIDYNDQIIIYCFKGSRASVALISLMQAGYANVKNYIASWNEWSRDLQLPIDDQICNDI